MKKWFLSSSGSGDLALTIKGLLMSIVPLVVIALRATGHEIVIGEAEIDQLVLAISGIVSGVAIIAGVVRKVFAFFSTKQS